MSFEQNLQKGLFASPGEKTFVDKVLAKDDIDKIRVLIKKTRLDRTDLLEILYLLSSSESKLLNYGEWDRYVILKFFVWIREFVKICEQLYDYQEDLEDKKIKLSKRTEQMFDNNMRLMEHNIKFLVDLYLNIGRTSLSIGATGLLEILKNKYEISYPQQQINPGVGQQQTGQLHTRSQ